MGLKSPERHRSSFIPIFAECSRESDVDSNCISSGHELYENIKLFIYYSFLFVCLFVCLFASETPRLIFLSRINEVFFMIRCLSHISEKGIKSLPCKLHF